MSTNNFGHVNEFEVNSTDSLDTASDYAAFLADKKRAAVFFMELTVRDRTESGEIFIPSEPVNVLAVNETEGEGAYSPTSETRFLSSRHWIGRPDDPIKPNSAPSRRLVAAFRVRRTTPYFPTEENRIQVIVANATLDNLRRDLDDLVYEKAIDATQAPIHHGPLDGPFSDAKLIAQPTIKGVETAGDDLRIQFSPPASQFATIQLQSAKYTGKGGLGGDVELKDTLKPFVFGYAFNMPATLIDKQSLVYQVHSRRINGIDAVYEGALEIPFMQDYPTYESLLAATITAGHYATCRLFGVFRLASAPTKRITASVFGDATAGSYVFNSGSILLRALTLLAGTPTSRLALSTFSKLSKAEIGWYNERKEYTLDQFINAILKPENAVLGEMRNGLLGIIKHRPVEEQPARKTIRIRPTQIEGKILQPSPIKKETLFYGWNWSPFTSEDEFVEDVLESDRGRFRDQALQIRATSGLISALRDDAVEAEKITWWSETSIAAVQDQANVDMELFGRARIPFEIQLGREGFEIRDGEVFELVVDRFGFGDGKKVVALNFDEAARGETVTLEVMA